jgi:hypothetical protein
MLARRKIILCLAVNSVILLTVALLILVFAQESTYWRIGWSDDLDIIGVKIDSGCKYAVLLALLALVNVSRVIVEEFGMPVLQFSIYNPDKTTITEFSKRELNFFGNAMFFVGAAQSLAHRCRHYAD